MIEKINQQLQPQAKTLICRNIQKKNSGLQAWPATFDGRGPWLYYPDHIDACAEISGWNGAVEGLYIGRVREARSRGSNLSIQLMNYDTLVLALCVCWGWG